MAAAAATGTALLSDYARDRATLADARRRGAEAQPLPVRLLPADARHILHLAALAPSGHNAQPWTVRLPGPYHWVIGNAPRGWLPVVGPTQHETTLSLGAFAQNLGYAAAHFGYRCRWEVRPATPQAAEVGVRLSRRP
ncbi:hypothetical protein ACFQ48_21055 [Hymenobacter caeli]|uniref:Nitroreductase n=1 Tax=Hymenobacter caeli TaxID=2735894 RepID=A0ABX2FSL8_9BACT|nr:hypothetical protein [Hymenobacter caeli]NRT20190.1 hypothetical protein [Hymenobacter caeli]